MSWQDRDYARVNGPVGRPVIGMPGRGGRSVVTVLIIINVAVYILCTLTAGPGRPIYYSGLFDFGAMATQNVLHGQIWRLMTSDYLHWSTMHILMNMIGLHFLGRPLEQLWGPRRFFGVYTVAGILGSLFYMLLEMMGVLRPGVAAGASGCVLGLLGAAAVLFPHAEVYIYFLFPVKIRVVAYVLGGFYVLNIFQAGQNAGGDACHLAGLAFGVWWAMRGEQWWSGRKRYARASRNNVGFKQRVRQRREDAQLVDRILAKLHNQGLQSLTEQEKRSLAEATARQQEDEGAYGRTDRL